MRVARYEFSKNHPTFPTKYSNSLYISKLYGRFSVVFFSQKIYLSYFFFQNRHFLVKKIFWGQTDPALMGPLDPPRALLLWRAIINGRFPLYRKTGILLYVVDFQLVTHFYLNFHFIQYFVIT